MAERKLSYYLNVLQQGKLSSLDLPVYDAPIPRIGERITSPLEEGKLARVVDVIYHLNVTSEGRVINNIKVVI